MLIPNPSPELAFHLAEVIETRRRATLANGVTPFAGMAEIRDCFLSVARSRQESPGSQFWDDMLEAALVTPKLLTRRQASIALASSERTIDRCVSTGQLPAVILADGSVRIRVADLDTFVASLPARPVKGCA